jgi:hypothetical protein
MSGFGAGLVERAAEETNDKYWELAGGPWIARWRRCGWLAALGFGRDATKNFEDGHEALAFFGTLGPRYRRKRVLRNSCLVTYKDMKDGAGGWDAVEPFAKDARKKLEATIAEIAAREGHGGGQPPKPGAFAGLKGISQRVSSRVVARPSIGRGKR